MFPNSSFGFKFEYYLSSLSPSFLILILFICISHFERYGLSFRFFLNSKRIILILIFICLVLSILCSLLTYWKLKSASASSGTLGTGEHRAIISDNYNVGFNGFILNTILPIVSIFSLNDSPISTFTVIILIQAMNFILFIHSNEIYPNITLVIFGVSLFKAKYDDKEIFVFARTRDVDALIDENREVVFISGDYQKSKKIAVDKDIS